MLKDTLISISPAEHKRLDKGELLELEVLDGRMGKLFLRLEQEPEEKDGGDVLFSKQCPICETPPFKNGQGLASHLRQTHPKQYKKLRAELFPKAR